MGMLSIQFKFGPIILIVGEKEAEEDATRIYNASSKLMHDICIRA